MIPNHTRITDAMHARWNVGVRFPSKPDRVMLDRVCAPMDHGPRVESEDGLNRIWHWDCASSTGTRSFGLLPRKVFGDVG